MFLLRPDPRLIANPLQPTDQCFVPTFLATVFESVAVAVLILCTTMLADPRRWDRGDLPTSTALIVRSVLATLRAVDLPNVQRPLLLPTNNAFHLYYLRRYDVLRPDAHAREW